MRDKSISLPKAMLEEVRRLIGKHPDLGYASVRSFVEDAVSRHARRISDAVGRSRARQTSC